jgi:hypothetical protein
MTTIEDLAAMVLAESRQRLARQYSQGQADAVTVSVRPGRAYTKIDRSGSGFLMVENATGRIYGIKAYGQVHKGHFYGTLDTIGDSYWGEYYPRPATPEDRPATADPGVRVTQSAEDAEYAAYDEDTQRERQGYPGQFAAGDGATTHIGSDAQAWTVIAVSPSGRTITLQGDTATLDPDFTPDFHPGGFAGHVSNSHDQSYSYARDPDGPVRQARLTVRGWSANGTPVSKGRRAFYDYNF